MSVVVLGAGIIGLAAAYELTEKGYQVEIIANYFPQDPSTLAKKDYSYYYTSPWAGAHYRPFPNVQPWDARESDYTRVTLKKFHEFAQIFYKTSVKFIEGVEWFEDEKPHYKRVGKGYSEGIPNFRRLNNAELPKDVSLGFKYETWSLTPPIFLWWLLQTLEARGVKFTVRTVDSVKEVYSLYPNCIGVVNCSGRGVTLDGSIDEFSTPIRGQTLLINPPPNHPYQNQTITHQDEKGIFTFIIPRPLTGTIIVGGTKQLGDTYDKPREADTQGLIAKASKLFPGLMKLNPKTGKKEFEILKVNVGFRPARSIGSRVELEKVGSKFLVHAYGVGGMGYEVSFGIAAKVVELVETGSRVRKL
ncbi:unnamed protein product [Kuraishia capsulata CBS 1993]|uniref:FAD dependent oxidoreductase domain-containing protein n=1 Tax=Kuraishia capsulata CBS 1993 TaxID=1382522 RepID=W6MV31_9ASCO|nr:uncharacterized protein KUCA_T00005735001 [Kuraishia capsulata CBS 1993]CDK29742.1 unnamed protein product [Kuraishia capsulata CBS 1993]